MVIEGVVVGHFHIQQNLTTDGQIGQSLVAQQKLVDANYGRAITTLNSDRSKIISASLRAYLLERINYGQGMPDVQAAERRTERPPRDAVAVTIG